MPRRTYGCFLGVNEGGFNAGAALIGVGLALAPEAGGYRRQMRASSARAVRVAPLVSRELAETPLPRGAPHTFTVGGYGASERLLGNLGEVIAYGVALPDVQRQAVETHLMGKWVP